MEQSYETLWLRIHLCDMFVAQLFWEGRSSKIEKQQSERVFVFKNLFKLQEVMRCTSTDKRPIDVSLRDTSIVPQSDMRVFYDLPP